MNPETAKIDALALPAGGVAIYEENLNLKQYRDEAKSYFSAGIASAALTTSCSTSVSTAFSDTEGGIAAACAPIAAGCAACV